MGELTRYRTRGILAASSISALVSGATSPIFFEFQAEPVMNGLFIGFFAAFFILAFRYLLLDWLAAKLAVWSVFLAGFAGYSLIIVGVAFVSFRVTRAERLFDPARLYSFALVFGILLSFVMNTILVISDIVGKQELGQLILGRYHRPALERRAFLFMDLQGSTSIAETLGNRRYLDFLNEAYADMSAAIIMSRAQIYKYVGDEIILTWSADRKGAEAGLRCFKLAASSLEAKEDSYRHRFGAVPRFRAGFHAGEVVTGQLGLLKKEITYIGDVMNTASRIMDESKRLGFSLVLSDASFEDLPAEEKRAFSELGEVQLRGKSQSVRLYGRYPRDGKVGRNS